MFPVPMDPQVVMVTSTTRPNPAFRSVRQGSNARRMTGRLNQNPDLLDALKSAVNGANKPSRPRRLALGTNYLA